MLDRVSYDIERKSILSNISLRIDRGEYVGIIGPNGGGKTTVLRLMLGLATPTKGTVTVHVPKKKIGYVPQRASSGDSMFPASVHEVVESGIIDSLSRKERNSRVKEALHMVEMTEHSSQRIGTLSGGERQRVMIARALAGKPEILLLDEPTAAIDPNFQEDFYRFLRSLHRDHHMAIIMVSHDTDAIAHEVQRIVCLNRHLVCHGKPEDVLHNAHVEHYGH